MSAGSFRGSYGKGAERTPGPAHLQVNLIYLWSLRGGDCVAQAWSSPTAQDRSSFQHREVCQVEQLPPPFQS